ncbi:MAG TPA: cytochrome C oxidase subunit I [Burkholderiaceae bacterium]|nr:cytochrome C oxidase subunit I [Burkholderiaceae bacterium]
MSDQGQGHLPDQGARTNKKNRRVLYVLLAVCLAPVVASYLAYYVFPPSGRTNYGALVEPQRPMQGFAARDERGEPVSFEALKGSWVMVLLAPAQCDAACAHRLWVMRQVRTATGKERERVERLWLITNDGAVSAELSSEYQGTIHWRANASAISEAFGVDAQSAGEHLWLVDPMGHLMMRWPREVDPSRMKKDVLRVLSASRAG